MDYDCSGPVFDSLVDAYTGKPMKVKMFLVRGKTLFSAPDAYSTADSYPTARDAYRAWNRVNGIEGLKDGKPIVCAYTGETLKLVHDEAGFRYEGGFDPHMLFPREKFLHFATMRDGKSDISPEPPGRVDAPPRRATVTENMRRHAEDRRVEPDDETIATAEKIMEKHKNILEKGPARVSMSMPRPKGKRK